MRKEQKESILNVLSPDQKDTLDKRLEEIKRFRGHRHPHRPDRGDFWGRSPWQRTGNIVAPSTNGEISTWGKIKNLFE